MGEVVIELYWKHAPNTCRNFAELCRRGYYNGTKFHRIIRDFMIQGWLTSRDILPVKFFNIIWLQVETLQAPGEVGLQFTAGISMMK